MQFGVINVSAAPVRKEPDHRSEMVNQLLFGETIQILKQKGRRWAKIKSLHDKYEGWLNVSLLQGTDELSANERCPFVVEDLITSVVSDGRCIHISAGSSLPAYKNEAFEIGETKYTTGGRVLNRFEEKPSPEIITRLAMAWLNVPYLWGGRSPMGVDCSGFTQVVFKQMGIDLPRDAWQQAEVGIEIKSINDALCGDLLFFSDKKRITHVGILLPDNKMIHASGKVKVDAIEEKGVTDSVSGKLVLKLKTIRRCL